MLTKIDCITYDSRGCLLSYIDISLETATSVLGPLLFVFFFSAEQASETFDKIFRLLDNIF